MSNPKEIIKSLVQQYRLPTINNLLKEDDQSFSGTKFLLSKLMSAPIQSVRNGSQVLFHVEGMQEPALQVVVNEDGSALGNGPYEARMNAILLAARIHEVESYDWVHLPWEQRAALVEAEARKINISSDEFKALMSKWVA